MGPLGLGLSMGGLRGRPLVLSPAFDFTSGRLPPGATIQRTTIGHCHAADGQLIARPPGAPRFDHDPVTGAVRGLLVEAAATNLLAWPTQLEQFAAINLCAVTPDAATAPDGSATADRLAPDAGDDLYPFVADTGFVKDPAATYTLSLYAKADTLRWLVLSGDLFGAGRLAWFDLTDGVIGVGGPNLIAATIAPAGNGWWRLAVTFTGSASEYCAITPAPAMGTLGGSYAADAGLYVWGLMLETGDRATSLALGTGAAAPRAADAVTLEWGATGLADGIATIRYTFDDDSTQDVVTTIAAGRAMVPTDLVRPWLTRAEPA